MLLTFFSSIHLKHNQLPHFTRHFSLDFFFLSPSVPQIFTAKVSKYYIGSLTLLYISLKSRYLLFSCKTDNIVQEHVIAVSLQIPEKKRGARKKILQSQTYKQLTFVITKQTGTLCTFCIQRTSTITLPTYSRFGYYSLSFCL